MKRVRDKKDLSNLVKKSLFYLGKDGFFSLEENLLLIELYGNDIEHLKQVLNRYSRFYDPATEDYMRKIMELADLDVDSKIILHQLGREGYLKLERTLLAMDLFGNDIEEIRNEIK